MTDAAKNWQALRADLESRVRAGQEAHEFMMGAAGYRSAKSWEKHARWLLARMDELENGVTLEAALDARENARLVTYDLSSVDRYTELTSALEDRAAAQREAALLEGGNEMRERWADLDDQMRAEAEAAFSGGTED